MKLIEKNYKNIISIYDYSLLNLSKYSDDSLYGCRLSLDLIAPSPINDCNIDDYIDLLNEYDKNENNEITVNIPQINIDEININPIKLNKNGRKRN